MSIAVCNLIQDCGKVLDLDFIPSAARQAEGRAFDRARELGRRE